MKASLRGVAMLAPAAIAAALLISAPAASAAPYTDEARASVNDTNPPLGGWLKLKLAGYEPLESIAIDFHSKVVRVATVQADAQGSATANVQVPAGFTCEHYVESTGLTSGRVTRVNIVVGDPADCRADEDPAEGGSDLPATGAAVGGLAAAGALLTLGGVVLVRRRRS